TDLLRVLLDVALLERLLMLEKDVMHLPEFALAHRGDGRAGRAVAVNMPLERVKLVDEPRFARMVVDRLFEHRCGVPAVRTLEIGELDDGNRRGRGPVTR